VINEDSAVKQCATAHIARFAKLVVEKATMLNTLLKDFPYKWW
jgi:hypothetical protein